MPNIIDKVGARKARGVTIKATELTESVVVRPKDYTFREKNV
jgi:hypothetical protein